MSVFFVSSFSVFSWGGKLRLFCGFIMQQLHKYVPILKMSFFSSKNQLDGDYGKLGRGGSEVCLTATHFILI